MVRLVTLLEKVDALVFDLDSTLYDHKRYAIGAWWAQHIAYVKKHVPGLADDHFKKNGYKQLVRKHDSIYHAVRSLYRFDLHDYCRAVYDIPLDPIPKDPELAEKFNALSLPKFIFTNSTAAYGQRICEHLDFRVNQIVGIEDLGFKAKPDPESYVGFFARTKCLPGRSMFFEDTASNLPYAKKWGMLTGHIHGGVPVDADYVDASFRTIHDFVHEAGPILATRDRGHKPSLVR